MRRTISEPWMNLPEEIAIEILCRLRIKPLFRFKCVSKHWNSVISDPKFRQNYLQRSSPSYHLSAILYPNVNCLPKNSRYLTNSARKLHDFDADDAPPSLYVSSFYKPLNAYRIKASSNGLILSCLTPQKYLCNKAQDESEYEHEFCVSNPITNQSVKLPTFWLSDYPWMCGLATRTSSENQDCISYKAVFIQVIRHNQNTESDPIMFATVDTFSSDTARFTRLAITCPAALLLGVGDKAQAITYNGILHFFDWKTRTIVTYDPYDTPDDFGLIQLPAGLGNKAVNSGVNLIRLGCNEELLEFGEIEDCGDCGDCGWRLCIWRLVDYDRREWCVEKRCLINPLWEETLLRDCRLLIAPDPCNPEFFCLLCANEDKVTVHDLASTEKVFVDPFEDKEISASSVSRLAGLLVPIALNPWSSPFHGEAGRNASSKAEYRKIIPSWFPSYSK